MLLGGGRGCGQWQGGGVTRGLLGASLTTALEVKRVAFVGPLSWQRPLGTPDAPH